MAPVRRPNRSLSSTTVLPSTFTNMLAKTHLILGALFATTCVIPTGCIAAPPTTIPQPAPATLKVDFGAQGPTSLSYGGHELLVPDVYLKWNVPGKNGDKPTEVQGGEAKVTAQGQTITRVYNGMTVATNYQQQGDNLRMNVTFRNTGDKAVSKIYFRPFALRFPRRPDGYRWGWGYQVSTDNDGEPGIVPANWGSGQMIATVDEIERPVTFGFGGDYGNDVPNVLMIQTLADDVLAPGAEKTYRFSLRFAPGDVSPMKVAPDLYQAFARAYPDILNWPDRRPIGALMMALSDSKWKTNPRGWFNDQSIDVTTEAGLKNFGERLMKYADDSIAEIKRTGGQGIIVWDVEGDEMPHAVTYMGDPRLLKQTTPEMDRFSDAYFKKFRDAGLKVGICIRPSKIVPYEGGWQHQQVDDPIAEMSDKINYAQKRWGATIFYMDTNVTTPLVPLAKDPLRGMWQGEATMIPASGINRLKRMHPDVLIAPEYGNLGYYAAVMPYGQMPQTTHTAPEIKAVYPNAGRALMVGDSKLPQIWDEALRGAAGGDISLFRGWFNDYLNPYTERLYREGDYLRQSANLKLTDAPLAQRLSDANAAKRYAALLQIDKPAPGVAALLAAQLPLEKDWVVQRKMVELLGRSRDAAAVPVLVGLLNDKSSGLDAFAGAALGDVGTAATPSLLPLLQDKDANNVQTALAALAKFSAPAALPQLLTLADSDDKEIRLSALKALGAQKSPPAHAKLLAALQSKDAEILTVAAHALARQGDKSDAPALIALLDRSVDELKDNNLRYEAGLALEELTGMRYGPYQDLWRKALGAG